MLHFTCDLCGKPLGDERYVAKLEVYPAFDPNELTEEDLDSDNLDAVAEMLTEMEQNGTPYPLEETNHLFRFDLCPHCRKKYVSDPLHREALRRLNFSEN